jgi:hypothetical protein
MPCSEYDTLVREYRYQRAFISSLESVEMKGHRFPAIGAKDVSCEVQAVLIQLQNSLHWHRNICAACKQIKDSATLVL